MPFLLLPLWRGLGPRAAVLVAVFIGWAFHEIWPQYDGAHMWYLGLFAMGMWAAHVAVRGVEIPWLGLVTLATCAGVGAGLLIWLSRVHDYMYLTEPAVGLAMALLLAWLADRRMHDRPTVLHHILESRLLVWVGLWSYSMYLIHSPLLGLGNLILLHKQMSDRDALPDRTRRRPAARAAGVLHLPSPGRASVHEPAPEGGRQPPPRHRARQRRTPTRWPTRLIPARSAVIVRG